MSVPGMHQANGTVTALEGGCVKTERTWADWIRLFWLAHIDGAQCVQARSAVVCTNFLFSYHPQLSKALMRNPIKRLFADGFSSLYGGAGTDSVRQDHCLAQTGRGPVSFRFGIITGSFFGK